MKENETIYDIISPDYDWESKPQYQSPSPMEKLHGKVVKVRFEPYYDVVVYEDGYEEWNAIGD